MFRLSMSWIFIICLKIIVIVFVFYILLQCLFSVRKKYEINQKMFYSAFTLWPIVQCPSNAQWTRICFLFCFFKFIIHSFYSHDDVFNGYTHTFCTTLCRYKRRTRKKFLFCAIFEWRNKMYRMKMFCMSVEQ